MDKARILRILLITSLVILATSLEMVVTSEVWTRAVTPHSGK